MTPKKAAQMNEKRKVYALIDSNNHCSGVYLISKEDAIALAVKTTQKTRQHTGNLQFGISVFESLDEFVYYGFIDDKEKS